MIISKKHKMGFIHIPKNAGRSVTIAMKQKWPDCRRAGWTHSTLSQSAKQAGNIKTFAVIRNPWERMVSLYCFVMQKKQYYKTRRGAERPTSELEALGFTNWLVNYGEMTGKMIFTETPQISWISRGGKITVDHIVRYENLEKDLRKLGLGGLKNLHKSEHKHYSEYYEEESLEFIKRKFTPDIESFGYEFKRI